MPADAHETESEKETARIEAFSDGVFAIAITLLVLDLRVPRDLADGRALLRALADQWPAYLAFVTSFAFIGIMWINHHKMFTYIRRADHGLLLLNTLFLLGITFVPFPTALLAAYLPRSGGNVATLVFTGTYTLLAVFFNLVWRYASHHNRLIGRSVDPHAVATITREYSFGPMLYVIAFLLGFVSVPASLAMNLALAAFWALPPRRRRARAEALTL